MRVQRLYLLGANEKSNSFMVLSFAGAGSLYWNCRNWNLPMLKFTNLVKVLIE